MKLRNLFLGVCSAVAVFAACQKEEQNLGTPDISIDKNEMTFEVAGGEQTLAVTATRDWKVETDADWVVVSPESGAASADPQTVTVTVLENTGMDRSADLKFTIGMKSKYLTVSQAGPGGSVEALIVYYNDFDKEEATKTYGSGSSWPYLDQFEGWKNATGTGAANVEYAFKGMSARANSTSDSNYSDYAGSGKNNMFFGATPYFATKNIALNGAKDFTLTFGTEKYSQDNGSVFTNSEFHIFLSVDGTKWVEHTDYTFAGGTTEGRWNLASTSFSVPEGTEALSICMQVDVASSYRMDDMKLVISEGGAAVDFSKATEMDFAAGNTGGGNQGGGSSDASAIYSNNFDKEISSKGSAGWPYCDEFDGWKNEAGTGAANVTYAFKSASARATSGSNNIWLPKAGGYFSVQDIALNGASSLELSFSVICGSPGNYKKTFDSNVFKVYLSSDKAKWVELPVTVTANGTEFDSAVATFSVPSNTANLSIVFEKISDESDGYRIDNINLISSTSAGTTIDFAQGVEKDFEEGSTSGGGNQGGGNTPVEGQPTNLIKATVAEFLAAEESSDVWYELTGEVTSIKEGNAYGNIYINDGTAEVYIYGLTNGWVGSNDKSFDSIGLKVGDTVTLGTLRGSYNGEPQGGGSKVPAFYISHVPGEGSGNEGGNEGGEDPVTPPAGGEGQYEPNITWTLGNKAYDKTSGSNAQTGTVNGVSVENMLKLGTSSLVGDATLHVPAGTKKLGFYCIAWKGKKANVKFSINGSEIGTVAPAANAGATGNPPYTITLADTDYYEVEMPSTEGGDVKVETLDNSNGRVIFIGLKAITE